MRTIFLKNTGVSRILIVLGGEAVAILLNALTTSGLQNGLLRIAMGSSAPRFVKHALSAGVSREHA